MIKSIGKFQLRNNGGFVARIQFEYYNELTNQWIHVNGTDDITLGFTETAEPGNYGVPEGSLVKLHVKVVWGSDNEAKEMFIYEKNNDLTACYAVSGTTLNNNLKYVGMLEAPMMRTGMGIADETVSENSYSDVMCSDEFMELAQDLTNASLAQNGCYGPLGWNVKLAVDPDDIFKSSIDAKISLLGVDIIDAGLNADNPKAVASINVKGVGITSELGADFERRTVYLKGGLNFVVYKKEFNLNLINF